MRFFGFLALAALAGFGAAYPMNQTSMASGSQNSSSSSDIDVTVLQFALTLEHLENVFYKEALSVFTEQDFIAAGFSSSSYQDLLFVVEDEQTHVQQLTAAIQQAGAMPVAACTYKFPIPDVQSFVTLSAVLEGVGASAYLGAASLISDKTILTTAASILVTESIHTSQQRGAIGQVPAANAEGSPISANAIFTLASAFIVSCPSSNAPLPFTAFTSLTASNSGCAASSSSSSSPLSPSSAPSGNATKTQSRRTLNTVLPSSAASPPSPAQMADMISVDAIGVSSDTTEASVEVISVQVDGKEAIVIEVCTPPSAGASAQFTAAKNIPSGSVITFVSGLSVVSVTEVQISGASIGVKIPEAVSGQTYVFVTNTAVSGGLPDTAVVAGPAILEVAPAPPQIDDSVL